jgi:GDP-L-fucose synthase
MIEANIIHEAWQAGVKKLLFLGSGEDIIIKELALTIAKVIGYEGAIEFDPTKPDGTPRKLMDSTRLNNLGWQASIPLAQGLRLAYNDFLKTYSD